MNGGKWDDDFLAQMIHTQTERVDFLPVEQKRKCDCSGSMRFSVNELVIILIPHAAFYFAVLRAHQINIHSKLLVFCLSDFIS